MRSKLLVVVMMSGVFAVAALALAVIASITGSVGMGVTAGMLGAAGFTLTCLAALRAASTFSRTADTLSTRAKNLETRTRELATRHGSLAELVQVQRDEVLQADQQVRAMAQQVSRIHKDVRSLRGRVPAGFLGPIEGELADLQATSRESRRLVFESALQLGRSPRDIVSARMADDLFKDYLSRGELIRLRPLIEKFDLLPTQNLTTLRSLYRHYRSTGYWDLAGFVVQQIHAISGQQTDAYACSRLQREIEVFRYPARVRPVLPDGSAYDAAGPIVHLVGRVLPETQTGYTLRTHYTALAQARKGIPVAVVGQSGITTQNLSAVEHYTHQGIDYYLLPGPVRNEVFTDEWLSGNMVEFANLVQDLRPSVLHAQSDFFNALIVNVVGKQYGIPTVYESRGFWEESWLSKTITANNWAQEADPFFAMYGKPAAYELRRHAEEVARLQPDHVFTLAEVMRDYILESAEGRIQSERVSIVPNAVEAANFPVLEPSRPLRHDIGLPAEAVVVGYISSMVEYEGIDTLLDGYSRARDLTDQPLCLVLVGDGDYLETLKTQVRERNIPHVVFTGRVPHEQVLDYYSLIDIFVVPRKPSRVSDLVTPLKPFEAFSTGRAVILSDVRALAEIARQSQAVELFRAGDADDLSRKIVGLVADPDRRHDLQRRAARWVRNHRSWDRNVNQYYRVYAQLGFQGGNTLLLDSELTLDDRGVNPGELAEALRATPAPALSGWFTIQDARQSAEAILHHGWKFASFEAVPIATIDDWARYGREHRSWGFHLHAWEFMDPLLMEYDRTGDESWLREATRIACAWWAANRTATEDTDPMVWYDMSQSLRSPRLLALLHRTARVDGLRDETVILAAAFAQHLDELHLPRAYNPRNNHGFYTAVSQVHASIYGRAFPDARRTGAEGRERLAEMATLQFAPDGVHLEHSPDYHRMLLNSFERAVTDGLIEDEEIKRRVERAARVFGWMIQPDGTLVQLGDSPETRVVREDASSIDPATLFLLSDGKEGEPEAEELAAYHDGGYAFVRSPQPSAPGELIRSGYLAFSAAFHSRAHKHADDLNVVWFDKGQQILTDAGRFGYGELLSSSAPQRSEGFYYAAPERQFVEGTMAHNTLMMDGANQERRTRQPYGSGLGRCQAAQGAFDLSGRVHHPDYIHRRRVIYRPGEELLLKDSVFSQSAETRDGTIWLNISGQFELEAVGDELLFVSRSAQGDIRLSISGPGRLVDPVKGQDSPLRGWRSRHDQSLEAVWSVGFTFPIETRASVDTRLRFV